ncbi:MAG TPA: acetyl-coenzyme A synthetase N-terminal domain-containing protein, partial [Micropepsaceae bacterium]|nr:acetyl-coenzyme A synthetase N-terminal domain-containing protein [Micropepsaceae bacterium]
MSETVIPVAEDWKKRALINAAQYESMYRRSIDDPDGFWGEEGRKLQWIKPFKTVKDTSYELRNFHIRWFPEGTLNVAANCTDR